MNELPDASTAMPAEAAPVWGAVVSMMLGVFGLVTAEFLPVSLLTPMASDLGIAESLAGQAISTTAMLAFAASLLVSTAMRRLDRRHVLLGFGVANYAGTYLAGYMLERNSKRVMVLAPLFIAMAGIALGNIGESPVLATTLVAIWGFAFGTVPVAWSNWVADTVPDEAESGGGLLVAAIQIAITAGAAVGGVVLRLDGITRVFDGAGLVLAGAALLILWRFSPGLAPSRPGPAVDGECDDELSECAAG